MKLYGLWYVCSVARGELVCKLATERFQVGQLACAGTVTVLPGRVAGVDTCARIPIFMDLVFTVS